MNEYEKRKVAITRYQSGERITQIVTTLDKTRQWFYNWLKRYNLRTDETTWYFDTIGLNEDKIKKYVQ